MSDRFLLIMLALMLGVCLATSASYILWGGPGEPIPDNCGALLCD